MSGFRGIFLDTIHPLIVKRLDADTHAFKQMALTKIQTSPPGGGEDDKGKPAGAAYLTETEAMRYFSERQVWMRAVPFAIPQTEYTADPNIIIEGIEEIMVPQWRNWVLWGTKAASVHGLSTAGDTGEEQQVPYGGPDSNFQKLYHSSNTFGWGGKHGLYRRDYQGWDGSSHSGMINSPLPGITGLQVSNKGDLGTIRRASFDIKVHNLMDLEAIEMMYMVPGLSVLIEWGWYHPKMVVEPIDVEMIKDGDKLASTTLINTEILKKSFGVDNGIPGDPTPLYNLEEAAQQDFGPLGPPAGIYDGLLGVVTKFNWTNDGQGGYDCRVDVVSPGSLAAGIPAESYNLGGSETIDGEDLPVTDLRTIITSIKKESRVVEESITEDNIQANTKSRFKTIKLATNTLSGNVVLQDTQDAKIDIPPHKLSTSEYGIKITLDANGTDLKYEKVEAGSKDAVDYFVGEYKGGSRQRVTKIYGDRTWWNKIMGLVTKGKDWNIKGKIDTGKWFKTRENEKIRDQINGSYCDWIMDTAGSNESYTMAQMEMYWGPSFRKGDFYITSNGKLKVKYQGTWWSSNTEWADNMYLNDSSYWYPHKFDPKSKDKTKGNGSKKGYLKPKMEYPNQNDVALGSRKVADNISKIGGTTAGSAKSTYNWTEGDGGYVDKSGQKVDAGGGWGSDSEDPVFVETVEGATVYKRVKDEEGDGYTYEEVASVEGLDASEIESRVKAKAAGIDDADKASRLKDLQDKIAKDAEITTKAGNFGAVTWGGPFDDGKPVAFGDAKYHVGIYAKAYPAFACKLHYLADKKVYQPAELGYTILQGDNPLYPIGMVAYSETYLSWRFVEDYLINELYMPRAEQPGTEKNTDPTVGLDTTFSSVNRLADGEKSILTDDFLSTLNGLIEKESGMLTEESRDREVYHSQHIINHPGLRSFNPEVCILPGQESLPPIKVSEETPDVPAPNPGDAGQLLDGDGKTPMSDKLADPLIKGDTCINKFMGLDANGNPDPSRGVLRNIMINSDLLEEAAAKSENVRKFCLTVLNAVNKACGEPWKFKILVNSALGKMSVIDENYTPPGNVSDYGLGYTYLDTGDGGTNSVGVYKFSGIGSDNILKDVKIQSKIPNELQTMAYYSTMGGDNTKGSSMQMFNMYRTGIVDRLRSISSVTILGNNTGSEEKRLVAEAQLITSYVEVLPQTRKVQSEGLANTEVFEEGEKLAKQYVRKYIHGDTLTVPGYRPPIPIDVTLSLHGISGLYMGNAIMIKTIQEGGLLPSRYRHNVALQATSVDHTISPEGWSTDIGTLMRPLPDSNHKPEIKVKLKTKTNIAVSDPTDLPIGNPYGTGNKWRVSSQFGNAEAFRKGSHGGLDIASPNGTKYVCCLPKASLVFRQQIGENDHKDSQGRTLANAHGYGYYVRLKGKGFGKTGKNTRYQIDYGHMQGFIDPDGSDDVMDWWQLTEYAKAKGWKVEKRAIYFPRSVKYGEVVGTCGGTRRMKGAGNSLGPHLHMTIKVGGVKQDPQLLVQDYYVAPGGGANDHGPNLG